MERDELVEIVNGIQSDTLIACRMYDALSIPRPIIKAKPKRKRRGQRGKRGKSEQPLQR